MAEVSPYIRYFPLIFQAGTAFNDTGRFNWPLLAWAASSCLAVICCNVLYIAEHGLRMELISAQDRIYETFILMYLLWNIPIMVRNRTNIALILRQISSPLLQNPLDERHQEIVKEYNKWIKVYAVLLIHYTFLFIGCSVLTLGPLLALPFYPASGPVQDLPLPMGKIPFHTDSYLVYSVAYVVSASAALAVTACYSSWFLALLYSCTRIRAELQLLVEDLLRTCSTELLHDCVRSHVTIMRYVGVVDKTFGLSMLALIQFSMVNSALALFQMTEVKTFTSQDYIVGCNITITGLFTIGIMCSCCQRVTTASNSLHRTMFAYNWVDKPPVFRRTLLVMMTVASRPLRITAGGVYPINMESYGSILQAIYSYVNILLTLRRK